MKWLRTIVLFDQGSVTASNDWRLVHESYVRSIHSVDFPLGTGKLTIRRKVRREDRQWNRNGVKYLKDRFFDHLTSTEGWVPEKRLNLNPDRPRIPFSLYPSGEEHFEAIASNFGGFDFVIDAPEGLKVAIEWETGNISSSHRSMNKLAIALQNGLIDAGVLIVPSRSLYEHLTDRIGNIAELSGYLPMWSGIKESLTKGLLAVTVVEHDETTDDPQHEYLPSGLDGRAKEGQTKRR